MRKALVTIDGRDYILYRDVVLFKGTDKEVSLNVASESLNSKIHQLIGRDGYCNRCLLDGQETSVCFVDSLYVYIAYDSDELCESDIAQGIEDVYESCD